MTSLENRPIRWQERTDILSSPAYPHLVDHRLTTMSYRILVSSNSDFVYTLCFSPTTGSLDLEHKTCTGHCPSWITPYPGDKSLIFTGLEQQEGKIVVLRLDNDGIGVVKKILSSGGSDPCSLFATESELFVANVCILRMLA